MVRGSHSLSRLCNAPGWVLRPMMLLSKNGTLSCLAALWKRTKKSKSVNVNDDEELPEEVVLESVPDELLITSVDQI